MKTNVPVAKLRTKTLFVVLGLTASAFLVLAQGKVGSGTHRQSAYPSYDPKTRPPVEVGDAYLLAMQHLGLATNSYHCISASCVDRTNAGFTGWTFVFASTNGLRGRVNVYFDRQVETVARSGEVIISR